MYYKRHEAAQRQFQLLHDKTDALCSVNSPNESNLFSTALPSFVTFYDNDEMDHYLQKLSTFENQVQKQLKKEEESNEDMSTTSQVITETDKYSIHFLRIQIDTHHFKNKIFVE